MFIFVTLRGGKKTLLLPYPSLHNLPIKLLEIKVTIYTCDEQWSPAIWLMGVVEEHNWIFTCKILRRKCDRIDANYVYRTCMIPTNVIQQCYRDISFIELHFQDGLTCALHLAPPPPLPPSALRLQNEPCEMNSGQDMLIPSMEWTDIEWLGQSKQNSST